MSSGIKLYKGAGLTDVKDDAKPLIEKVLWERDIVMLLGSEKAGKSILAQQMGFALTSGEYFLEKYKVVEPTAILYLQTEGKDAEMARRIECMARALPINRDLFYRAYKKFLPLDVPEFKQELMTIINGLDPKPKVMFIDSLYTSMVGDLVDNKDVRLFLAELSSINDAFNMATIIIHHEIKDSFELSSNGQQVKVNQGDKRSYGSVFLRAFVESILYFTNKGAPRDKKRELRSDTTRSGQTFEREELMLVEPDPLLFELMEDTEGEQNTVRCALGRGYSMLSEDIAREFKADAKKVQKALRFMESKKEVARDGGKWRLLKGES